MSQTARVLGWLLLVALVVVTLAPIEHRPVTAAPVSLERFGAFALLGFLFFLGYPARRLQVLALCVVGAGALEAMQMLDPSRHGRLPDFMAKASGCVFGGLASLPVRHVMLPRLKRAWPFASS
jgi:VanZ family protein